MNVGNGIKQDKYLSDRDDCLLMARTSQSIVRSGHIEACNDNMNN